MTLSSRLWLVGAVLPATVLALVLVIADRFFLLALESALDRALLAQAAVESGSMFDGPDGTPHLHMASSPLLESVRPFAPEGVIFGPSGVEVARYPSVATVAPERLPPEILDQGASLSTRSDSRGQRFRDLLTPVASPARQVYALRLSASMAQLDHSIESFRTIAVASVCAAGLVMVVLQVLLGRRLRQRLNALQAHLRRVEAGDYESPLPPEQERDELSALRGVLNAATVKLRQAHDAQVRLLANAAHELRTPLTLMRTNLDLALRRERSPAELKEAMIDARQEVMRLAELANRLLDTVSVGHGRLQREPVDLRALLNDSLACVAADGDERGIRFVLEAPACAPTECHGESVRQAVDNLLSNALRFAPAKSAITVSLRRASSSWVLSVSDEGPGIPLEEREKVFEPFHCVAGAAHGKGLGLTIVREVAQHHGGRAWVHETATGADVRVELPDAKA